MKVSTSQERIRQLMDMYNLTLSDLAKRTGLAKSTLSYYINGKSIPRQEQISQIADAFNINPAWLMGYDVKLPYKMEQDNFVITPEEMQMVVEYRLADENTKESISRLLAYWKMTYGKEATNDDKIPFFETFKYDPKRKRTKEELETIRDVFKHGTLPGIQTDSDIVIRNSGSSSGDAGDKGEDGQN